MGGEKPRKLEWQRAGHDASENDMVQTDGAPDSGHQRTLLSQGTCKVGWVSRWVEIQK